MLDVIPWLVFLQATGACDVSHLVAQEHVSRTFIVNIGMSWNSWDTSSLPM
jgi:hypothetical protein